MSIRHILCSTTVAFMFLSTVPGRVIAKESITEYSVENKDGFDKALDAYNNKDYEKAVKIARKLAKRNNAEAQNLLGICYFYGYGVEQSYDEAVKWWKKAAEQGHEEAKKELDFMEL